MPFEKPSPIPGNRRRYAAAPTPANRPYRIALAYKNIGPSISSHVGLGISAINTAKTLRAYGIYCDTWGISSIADLRTKISQARAEPPHIQPLTHVVISAPWLSAEDMQDLAIEQGAIEFAVTSHSNVGFLAADYRAFRLIREYMEVETGTANFHLAGNSDQLSKWIANTYGVVCWDLPNLYYLDGSAIATRPGFSGDTVKIGCFGANRILKNALSAGAAALQIASAMRIDLEFWISTGRDEGGGSGGVIKSLHEQFDGLKWAKIVENPWQTWPQFRQTVRHMHLLLQPSYTETFNVVTADGVAEGLASVVGNTIGWAPESWKCHVDDVGDIAGVGRRLLLDSLAPADGLAALTAYNESGFEDWVNYLENTSPHL